MILYNIHIFCIILSFASCLSKGEVVVREKRLLNEILEHDIIIIGKYSNSDKGEKIEIADQLRGFVDQNITKQLEIISRMPLKKNHKYLFLFRNKKNGSFAMFDINNKQHVCDVDPDKDKVIECVTIREIKEAILIEHDLDRGQNSK